MGVERETIGVLLGVLPRIRMAVCLPDHRDITGPLCIGSTHPIYEVYGPSATCVILVQVNAF